MGLDQTMGEQVQLQVGLGGGDRGGVCCQHGGYQGAAAGGQLVKQCARLAETTVFQSLPQCAALTGGNGDGLVAALVVQLGGHDVDHCRLGVEQRLGIVHLKPFTRGILGTDAESQAETFAHCVIP